MIAGIAASKGNMNLHFVLWRVKIWILKEELL